MTQIVINSIGVVRSPYKQKFAIPRQANLVPAAEATIELNSEFGDIHSLRGLEQFSHLWLVFYFHATADQGWSPTVQPPRLGGKEKVGVFASRSPFRPNPIGLSVVEYISHELTNSSSCIKVRGVDLLDGTPVLDIKPYIPYADSLPKAAGGYANEKPGSNFSVTFSTSALDVIEQSKFDHPELLELISQVLTQDPRPAWRIQAHDSKQYGMTLFELNIKWKVDGEQITVTEINSINPERSRKGFVNREDSVE